MHPPCSRLPVCLALLAVLAHVATAPAATPGARATLSISAGETDRIESLVSFPWPDARGSWDLLGADGARVAVQWADGHGWFLEPHLAAHTNKEYQLVPHQIGRGGPEPLRVKTQGELRIFQLGNRPVFTYVAGPGQLPRLGIPEPYRRGGYLHPVQTPAGRVVTDDYPAIHLHHHGLWFSWCKTVFDGRAPDFWNMGEKKGRTDFSALRGIEVGPVFAELKADHVFTDVLVNPPVRALNERWTVRLLAAGGPAGYHIFDLESAQQCATPTPLTLSKYIYGGLAYRGPEAWNGTNGLHYLDSNGTTNRLAANESRARWHWMGGLVDGHLAGLATLGHPENFRAPQPLRVHPQEPYSCWAPAQLGAWELRPGETYRSRYRVVALDGEPDPALLDRLWNDFASPPEVRVSPPAR